MPSVLLALLLAVGGPVVHVHSSSLYSRPPASLSHALAAYAGTGAGLVTLTETTGRTGALRRPGWGAYSRPTRTDTAIMWRRDRWRPVARWTTRLSPLRWYRPDGTRPRPVAAVWAVLERRDGLRVLVSVAHMPPHVQMRDSWRPGVPYRTAAYRDAVDRWGHLVMAARHRYRPGMVLVVADWNTDLRRPVWRRYVAGHFPGLRITWARPLPRSGTHRGGRLIDATLTDARGRAQLLPDDPSSDHRPYAERLVER